MSGIVIRPWVDHDMDFYVRIRVREDPWISPDSIRLSVDSDQRTFLQRWTAVADGEPVGVAHVMRYTDEPDHMCYVIVDEPHRGRGVGTQLFERLLEAPQTNPWLVDLADGPSSRTARRRGFEEVERSVLSRLMLDVGQPEEPGVRVITSEGIVAEGLVERVDESVRLSSTHPEAVDLGWVMTVGWALTDPGSLWALVEEDGRIVATTYASPASGSDWMLMWTGVVPEARGRGHARAVKRALHHGIVARGGTSIMTGNEARNTAIRALNAAMGYVEEGARLRMRRQAR